MPELNDLYAALAAETDFLQRLDIQGRIDDIEIKIGKQLAAKPVTSEFECFNCGA